MRINPKYLTPVLAAGAAALAITAAPIAAAAPTPVQQSCASNGAGTECQSPGNVEINDSPPAVGYDPYGDEGFLLGGYGYGGRGFGYGGHGGGFGGFGGHGGGGGHR